MPRPTVRKPNVALFASALDADDYTSLAALLADDCEYVTPKGTIHGPQEIIASYQTASASAKSRFDHVRYESRVLADLNGVSVVTFIDHLEHEGRRHTYSCEQAVHLDSDGRVCRIVHHELPGQREALEAFLSAFAAGADSVRPPLPGS